MIQDAIIRGYIDAKGLEKKPILPSSHLGSPRYLMQNYQDTMTICRQYKNPDLFITFTCNTKWPEILKALNSISGQRAKNRPDIVIKIFKIK